MRRLTYVCMLCLALALTAAARAGMAQAQRGNDARLRVTVLDQGGSAIVAARVRLEGADGARVQEGVTNQQGQVTLAAPAPGAYRLRVEASGFEPREVADVNVAAGTNGLEVHLDVANIVENIDVKIDEMEARTDPRGTAFSTVLNAEQIAQLPDDPVELEATLKQMAGPGAVIRVNGFRGGKLPPKSQIREIRFRRNSYAAENHEAGLVSVDIFTKPGSTGWHGAVTAAFRDEALSARNAFSPRRTPEQNRRFGFDLEGPLWRNRTSLFLSAEGGVLYDSKTVLAALPGGGLFNETLLRPSRMLNGSARVEHVLSAAHTLRASYHRFSRRDDNLGAGDFDLPERGFSNSIVDNVVRVSETGPLTKSLLNEFRAQVRWQGVDTRSVSAQPTVQVLNAFNGGGAQSTTDRNVRGLELEDNVDFALGGKHLLRAGVSLQAESYRSDDTQNANGTFTFASLDEFAAGRPSTYTRRVGDTAVAFSFYRFGWYVQDDIRVRKNLTVSAGLRQEMQSHLPDKANFAPRLGLAWSPFADGKTTFRAGAGVFYDWFPANVYEQTLRVNGQRQRDIVVLNPGYPDPFSGGQLLSLPPSRYQSDPRMKMPYVVQSSVAVERQLPYKFQFIGTYLNQRGVHLVRSRNINAPLPGFGRPDPLAGNVIQFEATANSSFNIGNATLTRFSSRYQLFVSYSLTKATGDSDGPFSLPVNNYDLRAERGPSPNDIRHSLLALVNVRLLKGVRLGTFFFDDSALPYNITTGRDDNFDSIVNDRPAGVGRNSARGAARWDVSTRLSWNFGFGSSGGADQPRPNAVSVSAQTNADVLGSFAPPSGREKRWQVELYAQFYNLFNHANPVNYAGVQTSPFFGRATSALPGRRIETGMRFSF